jgi:hypothetical protein
MMGMVFEGVCNEAFTFVPDDGSPEREYDISTLRVRLRTHQVKFALLTVDLDCLVPFLSVNRVWEQARVDDLTPDSYDLDPPIALREPDGSVIIADGVHRIMRRYQKGNTEVSIVLVDEKDAPRVQAGWGSLPGHDWGAPLDSLPKKK